MSQKLLIGGLILAIVAVMGFGLIDASQTAADETPVNPAEAAIPTATTTADITAIDAAPMRATVAAPVTEAEPEPGPIVQAQSAMGDPWQAIGTIGAVEDFGFALTTVDGDFYVELGPPTYWRAQGVTLVIGDVVSVDGYYNGEQVHARIVTTNAAQLVVRSESGQPMWAGGADHVAGSDQQGTGQIQAQVAPDDWLTLAGTIGSVTNGQIVLSLIDGTMLSLQMGRPDFWQSQGITLNVGDSVEVLGFWTGDQFTAGDIRKTETGETIMLRDPNGRQLWGGPGRNVQGNANQHSSTQGDATPDNRTQGNGYRGGREG